MLIQIEVTPEEAALLAHVMDLFENSEISQTIRMAPAFIFEYARLVLPFLEEPWAVDLISDADLERLLALWPVIYDTPVPTIQELRDRGQTDGVDYSDLEA